MTTTLISIPSGHISVQHTPTTTYLCLTAPDNLTYVEVTLTPADLALLTHALRTSRERSD